MNDCDKTREELIAELQLLREHVAALEAAETRLTCAQDLSQSYQAYLRARLEECTSDLTEAEERLVEETAKRQQVEAERDEHRRILYAILDTTPDHIIFKDRDLVYRLCNNSAAAFRGFRVEEIVGKTDFDMYAPEIAQHTRSEECALIEAGEAKTIEYGAQCSSGGDTRWFEVIKTPMRNAHGDVIGLLCNARDITDRKQLAESQKRLVDELRNALAEVNKLSGLLPICASCKRIRNEEGQWQQMEIYIREHSEAEFSHGLCPECAEQAYARFARSRAGEERGARRGLSKARSKPAHSAIVGNKD